jgi:hypothetical protein
MTRVRGTGRENVLRGEGSLFVEEDGAVDELGPDTRERVRVGLIRVQLREFLV